MGDCVDVSSTPRRQSFPLDSNDNLLSEQYRTLLPQRPMMYLAVFINILFLDYVSAPAIGSVAFILPIVVCCLIAVRVTLLWSPRSAARVLTVAQMRSSMTATLIVAFCIAVIPQWLGRNPCLWRRRDQGVCRLVRRTLHHQLCRLVVEPAAGGVYRRRDRHASAVDRVADVGRYRAGEHGSKYLARIAADRQHDLPAGPAAATDGRDAERHRVRKDEGQRSRLSRFADRPRQSPRLPRCAQGCVDCESRAARWRSA